MLDRISKAFREVVERGGTQEEALKFVCQVESIIENAHGVASETARDARQEFDHHYPAIAKDFFAAVDARLCLELEGQPNE